MLRVRDCQMIRYTDIQCCRAFHREYMLVQAQYFTEHMKSPYISVADNIIYPFNEYIGIIVGYGLFGIVLTAGVIILTFKASGQKNSFLL